MTESDNPYPREGGAPAPLEGVRVIDLTTPLGEMAGRVLADLGAEVIKVESQDGCEARTFPPFDESGGPRHGESLYWAAVGRGKKSVTLDLTCGPDREALLTLAQGADAVIESWRPGFAAALGLGYDAFSEAQPGIIYASVSPFGQDGPMAKAPAAELTIEASGGLVSLQGDGDRPNIPVGYPQSAFHAGAQAAADITIALFERMKSGLGQHLDLSAQSAMVWTLMNATGFPPMLGANPAATCENRAGPAAELVPGLRVPRLWLCKDGYCTGAFTLAGVGPRTLNELMRWAESYEAVPAELTGHDWTGWIRELADGELSVETAQTVVQTVAAFLETRTKYEIHEFATRTGSIMSAIYEVEDLPVDPHLVAREYMSDVDGYTHPGPFARFSNFALADSPRAPRIGEHQHLIEQPRESSQDAPLHGGGSRKLPFEGVKVADFAWVGVGPIITRALADHGATVVHIESSTHPDVLRQAAPFKDGEPGLDRAQFMSNFNTSKYGLACNLSLAGGVELARRVVDWADVVVESFVPGNMARWGLDYATLSKDRDDLVMLSTCLRGQTGPEATYTGFGGQGAAMAGIHSITGWPDRAPIGPWGAYTDFINPRFGIAALTSALMQRERTGEGAYIDLSQTEVGIRFIEPLFLDYTVNGRNAPPAGHNSLYAAPHTVLRCDGVERYVALACETTSHWRALLKVAPLDAFAGAEFNELAHRIAHKGAIEDVLREWALPQEPFAFADMLRNAGVPASVVLRPTDLYEDPQLLHREFFVTLEHAVMGPTPYDGHSTHFSGTPTRPWMAGPALGQHTDYVLRDLLGLTDEEVGAYATGEVLV